MSEQDDLDRYRYLQLKAKAAVAAQAQDQPDPTFAQQIPGIAGQAVKAAVASNPASLTQNFMQTDPAKMQEYGGALPIAGGILGGPVGAASGEFLRQVTGTGLNPATVPKTALGRAASVIGAGVMQEPKILEAIPGVPAAKEMASKALSKTGRGIAKGMQAFSGGKAGDFIEAAKKGYATYAAPSMEKAKSIFAKALESVPGENVVPTIKERMESAIASEPTQANEYLMDMAKRLDNGELIDARQALKAKQSLDTVIERVPFTEKTRRKDLFELKDTFDDILSNQSGKLKAASNTYRSAILKDNMTKFLPVNKNGEYSRLVPILSEVGNTVKALATSPLTLGALATTGGEVGQGITKLGQVPEIRQALMQILQKITAGKANAGTP